MVDFVFRAWTGRKMVYKFAVSSDGVPMAVLETEKKGRIVHEIAPKWLWMSWTGYHDRDGTQIFVRDVVQLGDDESKVVHAPVVFEGGRYSLRVPWIEADNNSVPLALYCSPAYVNLIKVVGHVFQRKWISLQK